MLSFKLMTSCLLLSLALSVYAYTETDPCLIKRKCGTLPETVYAADEHQCYLFRNRCIFDNDLCQRRKNYEKDLTIVSNEECATKCRDYCTEENSPLCAEFNNSFETFPNKCEFYRISCQTDKSFIITNNGSCEQTPPAD